MGLPKLWSLKRIKIGNFDQTLIHQYPNRKDSAILYSTVQACPKRTSLKVEG